MRVHVCTVRMTLHRADVLEAYLNGQDNIQKATVYERTGDVVLTYRGSRKDAAALLAAYRFDNEELEVLVTSHDSRKINQEYQEKMVSLVAGRMFRKVFLPAPIAAATSRGCGANRMRENAAARIAVLPRAVRRAPNRRIKGAGSAEASIAASGLIATIRPYAVLLGSKDALFSG